MPVTAWRVVLGSFVLPRYTLHGSERRLHLYTVQSAGTTKHSKL